MEDGYYDDLVCKLYDLADEFNAQDYVAKRLYALAGPDIRKECNWVRCEYQDSGWGRCTNPQAHGLRLCTYHGTVSSVRFDPKYGGSNV